MWNGNDVKDPHFQKYENAPPDVLGDEQSSEWTDTLQYLNNQLLEKQKQQEKVAEGLQVVIETLHGTDLTKIQENDEDDHAFKKRCIVVKWLHLLGGF